MLRKISFLLSLCLVFATLSFPVVADDTIIADNNATLIPSAEPYVENELLVLTNEMLDLSEYTQGDLFDFYGVPVIAIDPSFGSTPQEVEQWLSVVDDMFPYSLTLHPACTVTKAMSILKDNQSIINASPNYIITEDTYVSTIIPDTNTVTTNNTGTDYTQWALDSLQIDLAWGKGFTGSDDVIIGIVDSGNVAHTDLQNNLDMSLAYDSYNDNTDISTTDKHGNFIAGIIGADYDDGGIDGICQDVTMIPIQTYGQVHAEYGYDSICYGVSYAIRNGAKIINCSQKLPYNTTYLISLIGEANVLFVTSAGNEGVNMANSTDGSGKRNDSPYWIVVGSIDSQKQKAASSNYSSQYVDLFAPGVNIRSTTTDSYALGSGTSYAAPHVAAACALLMAKGTHLTPLQVRSLIINNVEELTGFDDYCVSGGTLSINNAIEALYDENRGAYTKGDVTGDGYVDQYDYIACRRIYFETLTPTAQQIEAADIDGNGEVGVTDMNMINRYYNRTVYFPPY